MRARRIWTHWFGGTVKQTIKWPPVAGSEDAAALWGAIVATWEKVAKDQGKKAEAKDLWPAVRLVLGLGEEVTNRHMGSRVAVLFGNRRKNKTPPWLVGIKGSTGWLKFTPEAPLTAPEDTIDSLTKRVLEAIFSEELYGPMSTSDVLGALGIKPDDDAAEKVFHVLMGYRGTLLSRDDGEDEWSPAPRGIVMALLGKAVALPADTGQAAEVERLTAELETECAARVTADEAADQATTELETARREHEELLGDPEALFTVLRKRHNFTLVFEDEADDAAS